MFGSNMYECITPMLEYATVHWIVGYCKSQKTIEQVKSSFPWLQARGRAVNRAYTTCSSLLTATDIVWVQKLYIYDINILQ